MKSNLNLVDLENLKSCAKQQWGPDQNYVFTKFDNLPFAPFSRLEKLGACCDFQNIMATRTGAKPLQSTRPQAPASAQYGGSQTTQPVVVPVQEDNDFITVSNTKDPKSKFNSMNIKKSQDERRRLQQQQAAEQERERDRLNNQPKKIKTAPTSRMKQVVNKTKFKEYTNIKVDWEQIHESQKINIEQHPIFNVTYSTIKTTGQLKKYDKSFDKIDPRFIKKLDTSKNLNLVSSATLKDDVMTSLIQQDLDDQVKTPTVYTTDALLLALMTCKKNEFPWDILVQKDGNVIVLDKYEEERMNYMDFQSVNENSSILPDDEKDLNKLCVEATTVTKKFQNQSCKEENGEIWDISEGNQNEIVEDQTIAFKYVCVNIDNKINIKVRVQLDGYDTINKIDPETEEQVQENVPIIARALNEFDHATQWKTKLQTQKGSITAGEYINNITNFMKWLIQMELSGAERLKLAYTSRAVAKQNQNHNILCVDSFSYDVLANIIQFRSKDQWQVVKYFIDQILNEQENGKYMFVKTAFKNSVKTYQLPPDQEGEEADNDADDDETVNI